MNINRRNVLQALAATIGSTLLTGLKPKSSPPAVVENAEQPRLVPGQPVFPIFGWAGVWTLEKHVRERLKENPQWDGSLPHTPDLQPTPGTPFRGYNHVYVGPSSLDPQYGVVECKSMGRDEGFWCNSFPLQHIHTEDEVKAEVLRQRNPFRTNVSSLSEWRKAYAKRGETLIINGLPRP
jgi:hypothetical protein